MNVARKLTATVVAEDPGVLRFAQAQHDEPVPGFIRQVKLGASGLLLLAGAAELLVPLDEVFKLAEGLDGRFLAPTGGKNQSGAQEIRKAGVARVRGGAKA